MPVPPEGGRLATARGIAMLAAMSIDETSPATPAPAPAEPAAPEAAAPEAGRSIAVPVAALAGVQGLVAGSLFAVPTVAPAIAADLGVEAATLVGAYMAAIFGLGIF